MSFLDHLEELRKRLIVSFVAVFVAFLICWKYAEVIFAKLQQPLAIALKGDKLAYTRLTGPFFLYMKVAFFADGLDINNPDFIRADGSHVFVDYRDFTAEGPDAPSGAAEAFGDASSIAAQGRQVYDL